MSAMDSERAAKGRSANKTLLDLKEMAMNNKTNSGKKLFEERVEQLHKEDLPGINYSNHSAFIAIYEKILEIEKKLDDLNLSRK